MNPRPESFGSSVQVQKDPDVLKGIEKQSGKLFPAAKCNEVPGNPKHFINNVFDEGEWYTTRTTHMRTHTFSETIDCYVKKSNNVQTTYV